jgi:UDP-N-acetylglucosamine--N-acetylmuramyl-(pentapeptide) pyrophosphoryl-undecaprenol N-acetylglucosamine transferase
MTDHTSGSPQRHHSSHIAIAGGGSGGHINASVAIAEELLHRDPDTRLTFFVSDRDIDKLVLKSAGLPTAIRVIAQSVRHSTSFRSHPFRFCKRMSGSVGRCRSEFRTDAPAMVIGVGGFASVPALVAAWRQKIPTLILEQNAVPGRATRLLSRIATVICTGFPVVPEYTHLLRRAIATGVPTRSAFRVSAKSTTATSQSPTGDDHRSGGTLLILGGSQGAHRVNTLVAEALTDASTLPSAWRLVHQTGFEQEAQMSAHWQRHGTRATVYPLIQAAEQAIREADIIISRAGAMTLAEICCCGRAAILLPLGSAADDHQLANAQFLTQHDAAAWVNEADPDAASQLGRTVARLIHEKELRRSMAIQAGLLATPHAAARVADLVIRHATATVSRTRVDAVLT